MTNTPEFRIGQGFDVHPYSDDLDRPLILGGVTFPPPGLVGHIDSDVIAHAITDAILGAAGLGDIGSMFSDTDPEHAGADSIRLLATATKTVRASGWKVVNVDCTVVLDTPKIAPRRDEMIGHLSGAVGAPVSVKGKRSEGVGALGRGEGVVCFANALLMLADHSN